MIKAAIYTRVSTGEQAREDKSSLGHQRERCEAYAKAQGWEVADDEGCPKPGQEQSSPQQASVRGEPKEAMPILSEP